VRSADPLDVSLGGTGKLLPHHPAPLLHLLPSRLRRLHWEWYPVARMLRRPLGCLLAPRLRLCWRAGVDVRGADCMAPSKARAGEEVAGAAALGYTARVGRRSFALCLRRSRSGLHFLPLGSTAAATAPLGPDLQPVLGRDGVQPEAVSAHCLTAQSVPLHSWSFASLATAPAQCGVQQEAVLAPCPDLAGLASLPLRRRSQNCRGK